MNSTLKKKALGGRVGPVRGTAYQMGIYVDRSRARAAYARHTQQAFLFIFSTGTCELTSRLNNQISRKASWQAESSFCVQRFPEGDALAWSYQWQAYF